MAWTEAARKKAIETKRLNGITNQFTKAEKLGLTKPKGVKNYSFLGKNTQKKLKKK